MSRESWGSRRGRREEEGCFWLWLRRGWDDGEKQGGVGHIRTEDNIMEYYGRIIMKTGELDRTKNNIIRMLIKRKENSCFCSVNSRIGWWAISQSLVVLRRIKTWIWQTKLRKRNKKEIPFPSFYHSILSISSPCNSWSSHLWQWSGSLTGDVCFTFYYPPGYHDESWCLWLGQT